MNAVVDTVTTIKGGSNQYAGTNGETLLWITGKGSRFFE
jgi:hypothetical protein